MKNTKSLFLNHLPLLAVLLLSLRLSVAFVVTTPSHNCRFRPRRKASTTKTMASVGVNSSTRRELQGKSVLLTGATGGLGSAFATQLAMSGVKTLILTARKLDSLKSIAQQCQELGNDLQIHCLECDLSDSNAVLQLGQSVQELGCVDILINNGGVSSRSRFLDTKIDVDQKVMQINFLSGAALAKAMVPRMIQQRSGRIIWISSVQGLVGIPNRTSYAASKFAVQGYCESLRAELASSGVAVHTVSPGYIRTNLSQCALTGDGGQYGKLDETTASGADPNETAVAILDRIVAGEVDFTIAATFSARAAIWMRLLCPSLLRSLLVKRYEKSLKEKDD